jgi:hypothetical protein
MSGWPLGANRPLELPARPMNVDGAGEGCPALAELARPENANGRRRSEDGDFLPISP